MSIKKWMNRLVQEKAAILCDRLITRCRFWDLCNRHEFVRTAE